MAVRAEIIGVDLNGLAVSVKSLVVLLQVGVSDAEVRPGVPGIRVDSKGLAVTGDAADIVVLDVA